MAVTIKQIAAAAGVSCGTVDRALHHRPGVNAEVAQKVLAIAKELNYSPNTLAKALANSGKSRKITVLLQAKGNAFYSEVISGMEAAAAAYAEYGISLSTIQLKGYDIVKQINTLKEIAETKPDGLILTPINDNRVVKLLNEFAGHHTEVVTLNADLTNVKRLCYVGCDYYGSGQLAGELLGLMLPYSAPQTVAVITGSLRQSGHKQRVEGFNDVLSTRFAHCQIVEVLQNDDDDQISQQITEKLLKDYPTLSGIYFGAGGTVGGLKAVAERNGNPHLRVITVDETTAVQEGLLSGNVQATVVQSPFDQGYESVKVICEKLLFDRAPNHSSIIMRNDVKLRYHIKPGGNEI